MDLTDRFAAAVAEREREAATVHERVACPKCEAVVGVRCFKLSSRPLEVRAGRVLPRVHTRHPHRERLHAAGLYER